MSRRGRSSKNTYVTLAHTEYITDITPSQNFEMQIDEPIQPGLPFLFPWLNTIARNFESWKCFKLIFHYRSTSADAVLSTVLPAGSTSLGSVIMMAQYNVLAEPPTTKREMLNNATATSCKPSNSMMFSVDPRASYKTLFVRTPYTPEGGDRRLYDLADFHLATEGMQASTGSIGELSVTAIMRFTKPTLVNEVDPFDQFQFSHTFTPAAAGNALGWFQFPFPVTTAVLHATTNSTMQGEIKIDPQDGITKYFFPTSSDNQIGSVYQIVMNVFALYNTPPANGAVEYFSLDVNLAANLSLSNCEVTTIDGHAGFFPTTTLPLVPTGLASATYVPNLVTFAGNRALTTSFFLRITGPNAKFGPNSLDPLNTCTFRCFTGAGAPVAPAGLGNWTRRIWISRVQFAGTG